MASKVADIPEGEDRVVRSVHAGGCCYIDNGSFLNMVHFIILV